MSVASSAAELASLMDGGNGGGPRQRVETGFSLREPEGGGERGGGRVGPRGGGGFGWDRLEEFMALLCEDVWLPNGTCQKDSNPRPLP